LKRSVVLHAATPSRRVLVATGEMPENALVPLALRAGAPDERFRPARAVDRRLENGLVAVAVEPDGSVTIDGRVRANDLVDEGDRGDLYHFDPVGEPVRAHTATATVVEDGPLRARLRIEQKLAVPRSLAADRRRRTDETRPLTAVTEVTLHAGQRRVDFATTLVNDAEDHRLRVLVHAPFHAERLDVEHGLAVLARPFDPARALGGGTERAAPTGQHHLFVDISDGQTGVALMSRGLPEHEAIREGDRTILALTLLRSVGWLSRGDLSVIDHAAGPMLPTPGAQELGAHHFEYSLFAHAGDWREGGVLDEARRYQAPAIAVSARGRLAVPPHALVASSARIAAIHPVAGGVLVRVLNAEPVEKEVTLRPAIAPREAVAVDPLEQPVDEPRLRLEDGVVRLTLRPWQLASVLLR
jgi:alpha-mannosidase